MKIKSANFLIFICFSMFWLSILLMTGTLNSGFHFTDDHELLSLKQAVTDQGFWDTLIMIWKNDLSIRFRPFYYLVRVIQAKLFGTRFLYWSLVQLALAIIASFTLFLCAHKLKFSRFLSIIFSLLIVVGAQSAIWWRHGTQEGMGLTLLGISLWLLVVAVEKNRKIELFLSLLFITLATLTKESFIIFIPAYLIFFIYCSVSFTPTLDLNQVIKNNVGIFVGLGLLLLSELLLIYFVVGTNKIGYAGVDKNFSLKQFIWNIIKFLKDSKIFLLILIGFFFMVQSYNFTNLRKGITWQRTRNYYLMVLLALAIAIPQFIIYDKSGLVERYNVPMIVGFAFLIIFLMKAIFQNMRITKVTKYTYYILVVGFIFFTSLKDVIPAAKSFSREGRATNKLLSAINENTAENDSILIVLNGFFDYEWGISITKYLKLMNGKKNIYYYNDKMNFSDEWPNYLQSDFSKLYHSNLVKKLDGNYKTVVILPYSFNDSIIKILKSKDSLSQIQYSNFNLFIDNK